MNDEQIAQEAADRIFSKCYDIGFNQTECKQIILDAIKKSRSLADK